MRSTLTFLSAVCLLGCGSSSTNNPPPDSGTSSDASMTADAADAGQPGLDAAGETGGNTVTLTVKNVLNWCSITINGGAASTDAVITAQVPRGTTTLVATPASSAFEIGPAPWFGIDENDGGLAAGVDNGSGATETSTATVTITGDHCVSVCCPFTNGSGCPTTTTCP